MQNAVTKNSKLPFKCPMLCVSLVGGSLVLALIFLIFYMGYISIEVAIWLSMGVFLLLAIYESLLLSLITRHMINSVDKKF